MGRLFYSTTDFTPTKQLCTYFETYLWLKNSWMLPLQSFKFAFNNPKFSDRILEVIEDDSEVAETIHISSLLLAAQSSFFQSMFSIGMRESTERNNKIVVGKGNAKYFVDMIRFLHGGELKTKKEEMLNLVLMADKYSVPMMVEETLKRARSASLDLPKCNQYLELLDTLSASTGPYLGLKKDCEEYLLAQFSDFNAQWNSKKFLTLSAQSLAVLLNSDKLRVYSENTVFQAVVRWLLADETRRDYLERLLPLLRYPLMSFNFLRDVVKTSPLGLNRELYQEAVDYHACMSERRKLLLLTSPTDVVQRMTPREACLEAKTVVFDWLVHPANTTESIYSDDFWAHGYCMYLQHSLHTDKSTYGVYLRLNVEETAVSSPYFFKMNYKIRTKNWLTGQFKTIGDSTNIFSDVDEMGGTAWGGTIGCDKLASIHCTKDNQIHYRVEVSLVEKD